VQHRVTSLIKRISEFSATILLDIDRNIYTSKVNTGACSRRFTLRQAQDERKNGPCMVSRAEPRSVPVVQVVECY
jgi:hypothetical protein